MIPKEKSTEVFRLKRYFTIAGFISTMIAVVMLVLFYRHMAINDIIDLGERNNMVLAKTVLNPVKGDLIEYLIKVNDAENTSESEYNLPTKLENAIQDAMSESSVVRTKIYNQNGVIVFSTKPGQIGADKSDNKQFISAIDGQVASKIIYNDAFSFFKKPTTEDNLIQSYVPVRLNITAPIYGVFEIYTDVSSIANRIERTEFIVIIGVVSILFLLYSLLSFIVKRAAITIDKQQSIIQERTRTLELLSSKMLNTQEIEKKYISEKLHEDVTQTLSSVKYNLENISADLQESYPDVIQLPLQQAVQTLHGVIQEIRTFAMEIHPPALDDFGLTKTIYLLCKEFRTVYPDFKIITSIELSEAGLPNSLKMLIYRITQEALGGIIRKGEADIVKLSLHRDAETITLSFEDNAVAYYSRKMSSGEDTVETVALAIIKERTLLSGGTISIERTPVGGTLAIATWTHS